MGNQGMTNWKFSAFFAIALMLIAGLFSTTAMAADGDGTIIITNLDTTSISDTEVPANKEAVGDIRLEAGKIIGMTFQYRIANPAVSKMNGGLFQMDIPWDFAAVIAANGVTPADAGGVEVTGFGTDGAQLSASGSKTLRVRLGDDWGTGGTQEVLTLTFTRIKVPAPDNLTDGPRNDRYEEYEFTASSRTRSGQLRELDNIIIREIGDEDEDGNSEEVLRVESGQSIVRVGNIASGKGTVVITPDKLYETYGDEEGPRRFVIKFTATGPMWNSLVDVVIPEEIDGISTTQLEAFKPSGSLAPTGHSGHLRLVGRGGEVEINLDSTNGTQGVDDGEGDAATTGGAQTIRINVKTMNTGQGFEMTYYSEIPTVTTRSITSNFIVRTDTTPLDTPGGALTDGAIPIGKNADGDPVATGVDASTGLVDHGTADYVTGGRLRPKDGSGTMMVTPMYAEVDSGVQRFTLTYTAVTRLRNAELIITVPAELLGTTADPIPLQAIDLYDLEVVEDKRNSSEAGYVYATDRRALPTTLQVTNAAGIIPDPLPTDSSINTITWKELDIDDKQTFRTIVLLATSGTVDDAGVIIDPDDGVVSTPDRDAETPDGIYPFYTDIDTGRVGAGDQSLEADSDASLYAVRSRNVDVSFTIDDVTATQSGTHIEYHAASKKTLKFQFAANNTAIKGGRVSFRIPVGWTAPVLPNDDANNAGRVTAMIDTDGAGNVAATAIDKAKVSPGRETTITVDALPQGGIIEVTYTDVTVQHNADTVDIIGEFRASPADRVDRRAGRVEVEVLNVEDGSGSATMSTGTSPAYTVRAGRIENTITVTFKAAGTMNGGQVSLERPDGWGDMQEGDADEPNYVTVTASGGTLDSANTSYVGREVVIANLEDFGKNNTVTFTISNAEAPSDIGVDVFVVKSAGSRDGRLTELGGDAKQPDNATDADLLGKIYWIELGGNEDAFDRGTDDTDGKLRVAVVSAADGTGVATVEIRSSNNPSAKYDGADVATQEVHAGDDSVYLLFTYIPGETIRDGELRFTVPTNWSIPQEADQGEHGYTYFEEVRNADIGAAVFTEGSRTVTVEIIEMTKDDGIQIHYGWHGIREGGAEAPKVARPGDAFGFQIKGSETGSPDRIDVLPTVRVREAASGAGTAEISPESAAAAEMETVTITYTAIGEIKDGALRLTVPDMWSDASSDNITVRGGGGSADHGRGYYEYDEDGETLVAKADKPDHTPSLLQVVVSGIRLNAGGTVVFTYNTQVGGTITDHTFTLEFQGGEGPGLDAEDPTVGFVAVSGNTATLGELVVSVGEAAAGTGEIAVMHDAIQAGDTASEITFIYTAAGQIDYPGTFAVRVPTAWSEADPAAGDYTVAYQNEEGVALRGTAQSVEEGAQDAADAGDDRDLIAKIRGAASPLVGAGHQVVFTYTSDAPATAGPHDFTVFYDDVAVGDVTVNVLSAEEATTVELASTESLDGTETPVAITINLVDDTGTAATSSSDLTVTLSSDVATGMFSDAADGTYGASPSFVITSGQTEMTVYYQDASGDAATVTATSGLPDATVDIATDVLKIVAGSASVTISDDKAAVGLDDTVTITAMANGAPKFAIGAIVTSGSMSATGTAGTYSGTWSPVSDLHDGTYTVTVTLGSASANAGQITVDTKAPGVEVTAPAAGMTVLNGATITISATVTDTTDVSVTADVSMLDSGAEADSVTLTDGTGTHTISDANTNDNGEYTITVTATDAAGNSGSGTTTVMLDNTRSFTSMIPSGLSMFHVPLDVEGIDTIGQLKAALGDDVVSVIPYHGGKWEPDSDDISITPDLGMFLVTRSTIEYEFVGHPWGGGSAMISVTAGANNLIGVPVDSGDMMISGIIELFPEGVVQAIVTAAGDGEYPQITGADDSDDAEVAGDAAYLVIATADATAMVSGAGWSNGTVGAAPIALSGYQLDTQTPVVSVYGSVVDEITGLAKEGFRAKVKNLSTKAALSSIISVEATDGFNMTFVDLTDAHAARVGDVLEISADSTDPLVGVKPVRHIVTVDDVKNSRIQLEDLIAYEIPAETELLRNYPNPFNPETWIPYHLSEDADVSLTIYGINGEVVRDIDVGHQTAAKYDTRAKAIYWDGRNRFGEQVASGIYFYHLDAGDFSGTRKMVILK